MAASYRAALRAIGNSGKLKGKSTRLGVWRCYASRKPFIVKIGTIFEDSHVPLRLWLQAIYRVAASKEGYERQPAPSEPGSGPQDRLVRGPSDSATARHTLD